MTRAKFLFVVAAVVGSSMPALAQSDMTLSKGQVLRVAPDGKISVAPMNMEAKMQSAMKKQAKKVTKGLVVWVDENGQMSFLTNPVDSSWVTGAPMKDMKDMKGMKR
jgi:hypothetical protein